MIEEIDILLESSPNIAKKFGSFARSLNEKWNKLQIGLLENSILDSTGQNESTSLNETILPDDEAIILDGRKYSESDVKSQNIFLNDGGASVQRIQHEVTDKVGQEVNPVDDYEAEGVKYTGDGESVNQLMEEPLTESKMYESGKSLNFEALNDAEFDPKQIAYRMEGSSDKDSGSEKETTTRDVVDKFFATCIDDKNYIDEFNKKIEALDVLLEQEKTFLKNRESKKMQGSLNLVFASKSGREKIKGKQRSGEEAEDLCSSIGSMISDSSGVYSFDHDDSLQTATDTMPFSVKTIFTMDRPIISESVALPNRNTFKNARQVESFSRQLAISDDLLQVGLSECKNEQTAEYGDLSQWKMGNLPSKESRDSTRPMNLTSEIGTGLSKKQMKSGAEDDKQSIENDSQQSDRTMYNSDTPVMTGNEDDDNNSFLEVEIPIATTECIVLEAIIPEPVRFEEVSAMETVAQISAVHKVEHAKESNLPLKSSIEAEMQNSTSLVTRPARQKKRKNAHLPADDMLSPDSGELDFAELFRKLESASKSSGDTEYSVADQVEAELEHNENLAVFAGPCINVIPPTPRRSSVCSHVSDKLSMKQDSFDLPDINIIPATPRRMSFTSKDLAVTTPVSVALSCQESGNSSKTANNELSYKPMPFGRSLSMTEVTPDINVIPPTPRRQSLDLSVPMIEVIPPTPRRQSMESEHNVDLTPIVIPVEDQSSNLQDEPSSPSLLSSKPCPMIPRVWNWLEKSVFDESCDSLDEALDETMDADWQKQHEDLRVTQRAEIEHEPIEAVSVAPVEQVDPLAIPLKVLSAAKYESSEDFVEGSQDKFAMVPTKRLPESTFNVGYDNFKESSTNVVVGGCKDASDLQQARKENEEGKQGEDVSPDSMSLSLTEVAGEGDIEVHVIRLENDVMKDEGLRGINLQEALKDEKGNGVNFAEYGTDLENDSVLLRIGSQLKDVGAERLALNQRRDSGNIDEGTTAVICLDDLIDNETNEAVAAGMDGFYERISNCLESMCNINKLVMNESKCENEKEEDLANHMRVCISFTFSDEISWFVC